MASGSEKVSQKWVEGTGRICWECGAEIKNLERDVGEVRTRYGASKHGQREVKCMNCHMRYARTTLGVEAP